MKKVFIICPVRNVSEEIYDNILAYVYALEHNVVRLADDHANASRLADRLATIGALKVEPVQTNMVFVRIAPDRCAPLAAYLESTGVTALIGPRTRLCTHLDVDAAGIDAAAAAFEAFFAA